MLSFQKNKSPCKFSPTATAQAPRAQSPHLAAGNSKTGSAHPHSQQQGPCRGHGGSAPQSHVVHVKAFICLCWSMLVHAGPCWSMLVHAGPCWSLTSPTNQLLKKNGEKQNFVSTCFYLYVDMQHSAHDFRISVGAMCVLKLLCAAAPLRRSSRYVRAMLCLLLRRCAVVRLRCAAALLFPCTCALLRRCAVVRLRLRQCAAALLRRCAVVWLQLRRCAAALLRRCAVVIGCTCAGALLRRCAEQVS